MLAKLIPVALCLISSTESLKFLCYSPRFAASHANFLGKLSDSLVDAGHEVVILSKVVNSRVSVGSDRARVIEIPQDDLGRAFENSTSSISAAVWRSRGAWQTLYKWTGLVDFAVAECETIINHPGLVEQLRAEQFDAAFGEANMQWCMAGILHLAGITKFAVTDSIGYKDGFYGATQVPTAPSYVPSIMGGWFGEEMTFYERAFNLFNTIVYSRFCFYSAPSYQKMFERNYPGFPDVVDLMAQNSLYFLNSEPLVDFPRLSAARMIDIGGIAVFKGFKKLNKEWSDILNLRGKTVFISFGTFAKAFVMPEAYKQTIRDTAKAFPEVTFIWKYEKPEHNVSQGIPNLLETTWAPQNDMLNDPRLTAFVTHCGSGSTIEANYAGVPLVVVPVHFDQIRSAFQVKRSGLGVILDKKDLGKPRILENAVREILENPKYKEKAMATAAMLNDKPFTAREVFVRNMEFLAKYGPLRQLDHYGRHLNFIQFYLIDVIAFVFIAIVAVVAVLFTVLRALSQKILIIKIKRD